MSKYDDEIREVEARLMREREALMAKAEDLGETARDAAVSPKGLLAAFAIGFVLGELTAPRRRKEKSQVVDTTKKVGLGGLIGSAVFAYARSHYGSPWALGRSAWEYAAAARARRAAAAARAAAASPVVTPSASADSVPPTPAGPAASARATPSPVYPERVRSASTHAAG
jgi:hypothetical protein